jgi:hypothetical protein
VIPNFNGGVTGSSALFDTIKSGLAPQALSKRSSYPGGACFGRTARRCRRMDCDEWAAKMRSHPDRVPGLDATRAYLKFDAVPTDEAALRQKFIGNPAILKLLGAKWVHIVKRVPLRIAPQAKPADTSKGPSHTIDR